MRHLSRVVWTDGMYLGPHHFQAQNRYFEDAVHFSSESLAFQPYGFLGSEIDRDALRNGNLSLIHARGILPDGMIFHMPEHDALPSPVLLSEAFSPVSDRLDVSLAVTAHRDDAANCAVADDSAADIASARYRAKECSVTDENTGRDGRNVLLAGKNIRLVLGSDIPEGLIGMKLARIRREGAGQFALDDEFVPPCLRIAASERLLLLLRRLIEVMEDKCRVIARPRDLGTPTAAGYSAEGISNAWFLHCINSMVGPLRHLYLAKRAHPEELFRELSRLAGALCTFGLTSHPADLPFYDHEKLAECFDKLDQHIRAHLELVVPSNCVPIALRHASQYFYDGDITDPRTLHRSRWILGVRCAIGESELIERCPRLIKVCSKEFLPKLVERALPGLKMTHLQAPPPALSPRVDTQYFSIDKAGPCWDHMVKTRQLALYVPGELPEPDVELNVILES